MRIQDAQALEPGHDDDAAAIMLRLDAARVYAGDAGLAVVAVGGDAGLGPRQGDGLHAEGVERHGHEGRALMLAGGQEHVQLARIRILGYRARQGQQLVGGVAHRGNDHDEVAAGHPLTGYARRHASDAVRIRDR